MHTRKTIWEVASALTAVMLLWPATAPAQSPGAAIGMVAGSQEVLARVPDHFVWLRDGLQIAYDPADGHIVFIDDDGRVVGRSRLPPDFQIGRIVADADPVRLLNTDGTRELLVPRQVDPASVRSLTSQPVAGERARQRARVVRQGPQRLVLEDDSRATGKRLEIRSLTGGRLAQAYEIGPRSAGTRYVVTEEMVSGNPVQVRVIVRRYDAGGQLTGLAFVPTDEMVVVPHDFISVTASGALRVLVPTADGVKIREMAFTAPAARKDQVIPDQALRATGTGVRDIAVETRVSKTPENNGQPPEEGAPFKLRLIMPPIKRDDVVKNANAFLTVNWVMKQENFARAGIDNACVPEQAKIWRRPVRFTVDSIGKTIGPMPYRWGGDDSPESYRLRIDWGALAGSICTCRNPAYDYCIERRSAGVDCSGLVSSAWGIKKRGTWGLLDVANDVRDFAELRPGDAMTWPGRHARLIVGTTGPFGDGITVVESSTRLECEGACRRDYRPSELSGYRMIRYRGISD